MDEYIKKSEAIKAIRENPSRMAMYTARAICAIEDLPTADVAPKSEVEALEKEVERLKHILDCYALQYGTVKEQQAVINKANQEFAREIFAEIDNIINDYKLSERNLRLMQHGEPSIDQRYAEFKKKYTEDVK